MTETINKRKNLVNLFDNGQLKIDKAMEKQQ
jgi:hypothetical protein